MLILHRPQCYIIKIHAKNELISIKYLRILFDKNYFIEKEEENKR